MGQQYWQSSMWTMAIPGIATSHAFPRSPLLGAWALLSSEAWWLCVEAGSYIDHAASVTD